MSNIGKEKIQLHQHDLELMEENHEDIILIWEIGRYNDIPISGICKRSYIDDKILFFATKSDQERFYIFELHNESFVHITNYIRDFRNNIGYCNDYGELYSSIVDMEEGYMKVARMSPLKTYELYTYPLFYVNYSCIINKQKEN